MSVTVLGGGLAGAAAACDLALGGERVLLLERESGPVDKICGEFLSAGAQARLAALGLDLAALGGHPISHLRLVRGARTVRTQLPFCGMGLSRRVLDEALLGRAATLGVEIRRGHAVGVTTGDGRLTLQAPGLELAPETLFLATGKHDLHGLRRAAEAPEALVGFKSYFSLSPAQEAALAGHVEVIMLADGYAGLQIVDGRRANLCLLAAQHRLRAAGGSWPTLLAGLRAESSHLRHRLEAATELLARPLTIYRVPYGFVHQPSGTAARPGLYRLGDQMGVIPSFAGDGMAIALHSAAVAARAHLTRGGAAAYHARIGADIAAQIGRAQALYRFARWSPGQAMLMAAATVFPGLLRLAARATRVSGG